MSAKIQSVIRKSISTISRELDNQNHHNADQNLQILEIQPRIVSIRPNHQEEPKIQPPVEVDSKSKSIVDRIRKAGQKEPRVLRTIERKIERSVEPRERPGDEIKKKPKLAISKIIETKIAIAEPTHPKTSTKIVEVQKVQEILDEEQPSATSSKKEATIKKRCKNWPNCPHGDSCMYVHPSETCPFFPKCIFGESCLYIHPSIPCRFGAECMRQDCAYTHPRANFKYPPQYNSFHPRGMRGGGKPKFGNHAGPRGGHGQAHEEEKASTGAEEQTL